jgi:hypothetical protein
LVLGVTIASGRAVAVGGIEEGLVGYWDFENVQGGIARDLSGNGNVGTIFGASTVPGIWRGNALSFDGMNDYVSVGDALELNPTFAVTVSAWIKAASVTGYPPIAKKSGLGSTQGYGYALEAHFNPKGTGPGAGLIVSTAGPSAVWPNWADITTDHWYFVAGVYDGTWLTTYWGDAANTPIALSRVPGSGNIAPSTNPLYIGSDPSNPSRFFDGLIDEVRVYDRALTGGEITDVYRVPAAVPEPASVVCGIIGLGMIGAYIKKHRSP